MNIITNYNNELCHCLLLFSLKLRYTNIQGFSVLQMCGIYAWVRILFNVEMNCRCQRQVFYFRELCFKLTFIYTGNRPSRAWRAWRECKY